MAAINHPSSPRPGGSAAKPTDLQSAHLELLLQLRDLVIAHVQHADQDGDPALQVGLIRGQLVGVLIELPHLRFQFRHPRLNRQRPSDLLCAREIRFPTRACARGRGLSPRGHQKFYSGKGLG